MEQINKLRKNISKIASGVILAGLCLIINGCDEGPKRRGPEEIISIEPHHATRIYITYKDINGQIYTDTIHQSSEFKCGNISIDPHDYLSLYGGSMQYGKFNSDMYSEYHRLHKK